MTRGTAEDGRRFRPWLAVAVFALAAVVLTWPVAWKVGEGMAGDGADANLFVWNHWWFAKALSEGESPWWTDQIYWPTGTSLVLHTLSPYHALLALPLAPLIGHVAAYNVLVLLSFALAAWSAYLLAREVGASEAGAYLAGFAFGFTGYHYAHALGHLNLLAYQWIAFFLVFFLRHVRSGRRRHAFGAALMLVGAGLTDLGMMFTVALLAGVFSLVWHGLRSPEAYLRVLLPGLMAALLLSPLLGLILQEYLAKPELAGFSDEAGRYSVDALSYVWPTPFSTLYEDVGRVLPKDGTMTEATVFVGFAVLALAVYAVVVRPWSLTRPWVLTAAVFYVLSLGPRLQVWGLQTGVPMPYVLLQWTPLLNTLRTPARLGLVVLLCAALLAAMGLTHLLARIPARRRAAAPVVAALLCALVLAESVVVPFPVTPMRYSPLYEDAKALGTEAVVDLPLHQPGYAGQLGRVNYLAAQTVHEMPMVNGYNARQTSRDTQTIHAQQVLSLLTRVELDLLPPERGDVFPSQDARAVAGDLLAARGMRALLLHRSDPPTEAEAREIAFLDTLQGVRLVKEGPDGALYEAVPSAAPPPLLFDLAAGWHGVELFEERPGRWTFGTAQVLVHAADATEGNLTFRVTPFLRGGMDARTLQVVVEGEIVHEQAVPAGWHEVVVPVHLAQGTNHVTLHSVEAPTTPRQARVSWDARPLAFAVQDVRVVASWEP